MAVISVFLFLLFLALSTAAPISATLDSLPRVRKAAAAATTTNISVVDDDFEIFYYNQTLDHFNYQPASLQIFKQKFFMSLKYWGGADSNSPILAFLGGESPLTSASGLMVTQFAEDLQAAQFFIEHRFYGDSNPMGANSMRKSLNNATMRGYFNSAQALADYAEILLYLKRELGSQQSPVTVFGGSYSGMLAAWFRLKYPHIAIGALASSAPVFLVDELIAHPGFFDIVSNDFRSRSETCYQMIRSSWIKIDRISSLPDGLSLLSKKFNACSSQVDSDMVRDFCSELDAATLQDPDVLGRIAAFLKRFQLSPNCLPTQIVQQDESVLGWQWQTCTEIILPLYASIGSGIGGSHTMFPPITFELEEYEKKCTTLFGVSPRPHWLASYFGGHDIKLALKRFGSNIIFSNGLRDPFSCGGVLKNISDSIVALYTVGGSHGWDLIGATTNDPAWLTDQRLKEAQLMSGWLRQYHADLHVIS